MDLAARLPDPQPEDDEDVVWGLSTARSLWARGDRQDAIVWLRRAADAASAAGQPFRASELGMYATELEDTLASSPADASAQETVKNGPTPPAEVQVALPVEEEPVRVSAAPIELDEIEEVPPVPSVAPATPPTVQIAKPVAAVIEAKKSEAPPANTEESPASTPFSKTLASEPAAAHKKKPPRAPILDPWAEDEAAVAHPTSQAPRVIANKDELIVQMRSRPQAAKPGEDEDVFTSAVPLDTALRKTKTVAKIGAPPPPPPPPARTRTATIPEPQSGQLYGVTVAAKAPVSVPSPATTGGSRAPQTPETANVPPISAPAPMPPHSVPFAGAIASHPPPASEIASSEVVRAPMTPPPATLPAANGALAAAEAKAEAKVELAPPSSKDGRTSSPQIAPVSSKKKDSVPASAGPRLGGIALGEVAELADLPIDVLEKLVKEARVEKIGADEEVSGFGAALVLTGEASVCATIVDAPALRVKAGLLVPSKGSLAEGIPTRVVAGADGAEVAVWDQSMLDEALRSCPWVMDELVVRCDRIQARAGATMGLLGDVDEASRNLLLDRLQVRVARPLEVIAELGKPTSGILLVGAGFVDLLGPCAIARPGEVLFARETIEGRPASSDARTGPQGALLLVAPKSVAQELFVSVPQLVTFLGGGG